MTKRTGILLTNVGTPAAPTAKAVRQFLKEFLSDPRVVEIPRAIWLPLLYGFILPIRAKKSAALYQKIWTEHGSPLLYFSQKIANALEQNLKLPVALGMHYGAPSIETALEELRNENVEKILVLPMFPQYSATTTAVSFDLVSETLKKWRNVPELHMIRDYSTDDHYLDAVASSIKDQTQYLLFSFHGLPKRFVDQGDPYERLCHQTANQLARKLQLKPDNWSVAFQSRLGKAEWLQPYTESVFASLPKKGIERVQVICPGFAVDCLETLEEIAIRGKETFMKHGGKEFQYIPALNDSDGHVLALSALIQKYL